MNDLARLSATERQRIIDEFVDATFAGTDPAGPASGIAAAMRQLPGELPVDPSDEQVDAWLELAELVADPAFRQRVRQMAVGAAPADPQPGYDPQLVTQHAGPAMAAGVVPDSPEGAAVLDRIVDPALPRPDRIKLAESIEEFTDRRVERYWQLMAVLNGRPSFPSIVPAFEWLIAALRAAR